MVLAAPTQAQPITGVQGTVLYEIIDQLPPLNVPPGMEAIAASLPKELKRTARLRFQDDAVITDDVATESAGMLVSTLTIYANYGAGQRVSQLPLGRETLLVEAPVEPIAWQITGEEGEFLGYPMLKAVATVDARAVEAWFTPAILASVGPYLYHGLPGLILILTEDGGERAVRATSVSLDSLAEPVMPPTEGRAVSSEEYKRLAMAYGEALDQALRESLEEDD